MIQYFLSEGFFHKHKLLLGQISGNTAQLPAVVSSDAASESKDKDSDKMTIAWRYEGQSPKGEELLTSKTSNHHFNLNKTISQEALSSLMTSWYYDGPNVTNAYNDSFLSISRASKPFEIDPKAPGRNILRVGLFDLGNALMHTCEEDGEKELLTFLYRLRALARSHLVVVMLSLSPDFHVHEVGGDAHKKVLEMCDFVINLTSFSKGERQSGPFKDHHGLINLHKASPLNCLQNMSNHSNVRTNHLFKSLRTKFSISPMHLPPDDAEITGESLKNLDF